MHLTFIDDSDFDLVESWKQNDDGSVGWECQGTNGAIWDGLTRADSEGNTVDIWAKLQAKIDAGEVSVQGKTAEEIAAEEIAAFKAGREIAISSLTVTTSAGNIYQADAVSTAKMGTRVVALMGVDDTYITKWSLADTDTGVMTDVTYADLKEALRLATDGITDEWGVNDA